MAIQNNQEDGMQMSNTHTYRSVTHAVFHDPSNASRAVGALLDLGINPYDVSILMKNPPEGWNKHTTGEDLKETATVGLTVTTPHDAGVGAVKGTGIGLGVGALAAVAALTIPGVGLVIGGGALAAAIGATFAAGAAGAISGAVYGSLKDQGVDEHIALAAEKDFENGAAIVSVTTPSENVSNDVVEQIFAKYQDGAYMAGARSEIDVREDVDGRRIYAPHKPL